LRSDTGDALGYIVFGTRNKRIPELPCRHGHVRLPGSFAADPPGDSSDALAGGKLSSQRLYTRK